MITGHTHCAVTFWGVMNSPRKLAHVLMVPMENIFGVLQSFYRKHPKETIELGQLAKQARVTVQEALQSVKFLERSPIIVSAHTQGGTTRITVNENCVTTRDFHELQKKARAEGRVPLGPPLSRSFVATDSDLRITRSLSNAESEAVRTSWQKAIERVVIDPAAAITASRSLMEAACKFVIEEFGGVVNDRSELQKLYKQAAALLNLEAHGDVSDAMRQVLGACASIVDGLAQIRNRLGDAHGKGRRSQKPGRRHAELAILTAAAVSGLLLTSVDAQRNP
jgi:hypothetical protein